MIEERSTSLIVVLLLLRLLEAIQVPSSEEVAEETSVSELANDNKTHSKRAMMVHLRLSASGKTSERGP